MKNKILLSKQKFIGITFIFLLLGSLTMAITQPGHAQSRVFPEPPILLEPKSNVTYKFPGTETLIRFSWEPVENATSYEINVVVNRRPAAVSIRTDNTIIDLNLLLTIQEIRSNVTWTVRAFSGETAGTISEFASFVFNETGQPLPGVTPKPAQPPTPTPTKVILPAPILLLPENGALINPADFQIQFDWTTVTGAAGYLFNIYEDNDIRDQRTLTRSDVVVSFQSILAKTFQWDVRAIDSTGVPGHTAEQFSFVYGFGFLPTPTPFPPSADLDGNQQLNAADIYHFAATFRTNEPKTDYDQSGITDKPDLLRFIELFFANR